MTSFFILSLISAFFLLWSIEWEPKFRFGWLCKGVLILAFLLLTFMLLHEFVGQLAKLHWQSVN